MKTNRKRIIYAVFFTSIFIAEVLIALFLNDNFIRPYVGDVLVTVLICCFIRIFIPDKLKSLPIWVFLFATAVEIGQYFDFVSLLGLGDIKFFRILLGTTFSFADLICYAVGCAVFFTSEKIIYRISCKNV